jgi:type II secretory pathway pseudopilin PulG
MIFGRRRVHAFSLVEVTLAMGIAAFCLIAAFGLMPLGVQTNRNSTSQSAAVNIMAAVVADLRAISKPYDNSKIYYSGNQVVSGSSCYVYIATSPTSGHTPPNPTYWSAGSSCPRFGIIFPTTFPTTNTLYFDDAGRSPPVTDSRYRLDVTFLTWSSANLDGTGRYGANLKVTWPALANPATPSGPSGTAEMFAAFDRN